MARNARQEAKDLVGGQSTSTLKRSLRSISGGTREQIIARGFIIDELGERADKWTEKASTNMIVDELAKIVESTTNWSTADGIMSDAYAMELIQRNPEALEAFNQWEEGHSGTGETVLDREAGPHVLKAMKEAGYGKK